MSFQTIVVDPPWRYTQNPTERTGGGVSAEHQYPTMWTDEIAKLPVQNLAADSAHLYMWVTNPVLLGQRRTIMGQLSVEEIVKAWGFQPITLITWVKTSKSGETLKGGTGWYFRGATEHAVFAIRGKAPIPAELREPNVLETDGVAYMAMRGRHSAKPSEFMEMVERVSPGPYVELFARGDRENWERWGNEVESTVDFEPAGTVNPFLT